MTEAAMEAVMEAAMKATEATSELATKTPAQPSKAVRVTFFEDRAEVTRTAKVTAAEGRGWVALAGISPFVDERSITARVISEGAPGGDGEGARVLAARARLFVHHDKVLGREEIEALEAELERTQRASVAAERALERARGAEARVEDLLSRWIEGASIAPRGARASDTLAQWREALTALDRSATASLDAAHAARRDRAIANDELLHAEARLLNGSIERPRYEAQIEVQIEAPEAGEVELEITYRVPCALWRPEHMVRLASAAEVGARAPIEIVTFATAWQCTGEAWDDIEVRFSTARPARLATPPTLGEDVLASRRKTDAERRRVHVDVREQAITTAGLDRGARAVDEMPGVDDGGEPVQLAPRERVSIASDGLPFRVEVKRVEVEADIERVLWPEAAPVAHLRATATLAQGGPLLAGPIRIARGKSLVGRAKLDFVGAGEPFEVALGTDDSVRVRRTQSEERETATLTGTQKIKRKVKVFLSNLSSEAKKVLVTERVLVSEIEDVEVSLTNASGWKHDKADGFLRRTVELSPHATETLELGYELRASSKVVLPF